MSKKQFRFQQKPKTHHKESSPQLSLIIQGVSTIKTSNNSGTSQKKSEWQLRPKMDIHEQLKQSKKQQKPIHQLNRKYRRQKQVSNNAKYMFELQDKLITKQNNIISKLNRQLETAKSYIKERQRGKLEESKNSFQQPSVFDQVQPKISKSDFETIQPKQNNDFNLGLPSAFDQPQPFQGMQQPQKVVNQPEFPFDDKNLIQTEERIWTDNYKTISDPTINAKKTSNPTLKNRSFNKQMSVIPENTLARQPTGTVQDLQDLTISEYTLVSQPSHIVKEPDLIQPDIIEKDLIESETLIRQPTNTTNINQETITQGKSVNIFDQDTILKGRVRKSDKQEQGYHTLMKKSQDIQMKQSSSLLQSSELGTPGIYVGNYYFLNNYFRIIQQLKQNSDLESMFNKPTIETKFRRKTVQFKSQPKKKFLNIIPLLNQGDQEENFQILSKGVVLENQVIYDVKYVGKILVQEQLQLREIYLDNLYDFENLMDQIIEYQNYVKSFESPEFQTVYQFWGAESEKSQFILYVVTEKLVSVRNLLNRIASQNQNNIQVFENQKATFNQLILAITKSSVKIDENRKFILPLGIDLDNVFLRQVDQEDIGVFSFKYQNNCPKSESQNNQIERQRHIHQCIAFLIRQIIQYMEDFNLDLVSTIEERKSVFIKKKHFDQNQVKKLLGQGANGKVYEVKTDQNKFQALKQMEHNNFYQISQYYKEFQLGHLFFYQQSNQDSLPLIKVLDLFLEYDQSKPNRFTLNILMQRAQCDLACIIKKQKGPMDFKTFFPFFRECISGLCLVHSKAVAHRDIKPQNIMKIINLNHYVLADYGEGKNLAFEGEYTEETQFQIGEFQIQGTPAFLDPKLLAAYKAGQTQAKLDLFKADVYSMGLTLLLTASGQTIKGFNQSEKMEKIILAILNQLDLPISIKQTISHMLAFNDEHRIPTYSLYQALKDIQKKLYRGFERACIEDKFTQYSIKKYAEIYGDLMDNYTFSSKLKSISFGDQPFYTGHLKLVHDNSEKLYSGQVVIARNYFTYGKVMQEVENLGDNHESYTIFGMGPPSRWQPEVIKRNDLFSFEYPIYKQGDYLVLLVKDDWIPCKLLKPIDTTKKQYILAIEDEYGQTQTITVNQNTLNLKPDGIFYQNFNCQDSQIQYSKEQSIEITNDEIKQFTKKIIFNLYDPFVEHEKKLSQIMNYISQNCYFIRINLKSGQKNPQKQIEIINAIPANIWVYHIYICDGGDINEWKNIHQQFPRIQKLNVEQCAIDPLNLYDFQTCMNKIKSLYYFKFNDLEYSGHMDIIMYSNPYRNVIPILNKGKIQNLLIDSWQSQINVSQEFLIELLNSISRNQFDKLVLQLIVPSSKNAHSKEGFKKAINKFMLSQRLIQHFEFYVILEQTELGTEIFDKNLPVFFMNNTNLHRNCFIEAREAKSLNKTNELKERVELLNQALKDSQKYPRFQAIYYQGITYEGFKIKKFNVKAKNIIKEASGYKLVGKSQQFGGCG